MYAGQLVFAQLMQWLPRHAFQTCVRRYGGDARLRGFSCRDQFLCMAYAQLTHRESLRDIEICLRAHKDKLYHAGIRGRVARSTLSDANQAHDWRIYADLASVLIARARRLYAHDPFGVDLDQIVYALDSTTIDLCLSLFLWARFRPTKAAIKLDTLLDLRGAIPSFLRIRPGAGHEISVLDALPIEAGAFYLMDRGFLDFGRLYRLQQHRAFFIIRARRNLDFVRRSSYPVDKTSGLRCDQSIRLGGPHVSKKYPDPLRRIVVVTAETKQRLVLLTNNDLLPAETIAELYRCRWQVELFFKWIKQHLKIKSFFGNTDNAVRTQLWIAVCVYVMIATLKKELGVGLNLTEMLQVLSVTVFEKTPLKRLFQVDPAENPEPPHSNQGLLFDL